MNCPCGKPTSLEACCGPAISGESPAATAEALMRSRYSAYVLGEVDYIVSTHDPDSEDEDIQPEAIEAWSKGATWKGLEIVTTARGGEDDEVGIVEFIARYETNGGTVSHHEISHFRRHEGSWVYAWGEEPGPRRVTKVGRNEPCPCGSGKKYKKCCGK